MSTCARRARGVALAALAATGGAGCGGCGDAPMATPPPPLCRDDAEGAPFTLQLVDGWAIQSSARVGVADAVVSTTAFRADGFYPTTVPATVVGALAANHVYPDPYVGRNLRQWPGVDYPDGSVFAFYPMSDSSPFRVPWWYRTTFSLPERLGGKRVWLRLDGLTYRAAVWLNGRLIAGESAVAGTYRRFELDVTDAVSSCAPNVLAVKVTAATVDSLAHNWVDWAPFPPDKNQGLWRPVTVFSTGPVRLRAPHVITRLDLPATDHAHVTVTVDAINTGAAPVTVRVAGSIAPAPSPHGDPGAPPAPPIAFSDEVTLGARETRTLRFEPSRFPALDVAHPRLWWPLDLGAQDLYALTLRAEVAGALSDEASARFGVRQVTSELTSEGHRLFRVNGRRVLVRGGGFSPDLLLRADDHRTDDQIAYVREMHLNAIRLEGKVGDEHLYDRCDEEGVLVMAGWCCCDHWEDPDGWVAEDRTIAIESLKDQIRALRNHPSALVWLNGSDSHPPEAMEQAYVDTLRALEWQPPTLASANSTVTPVLGVAGVKMTGPYLWVPPAYWYVDHTYGGAFGFITETSAGEAIPTLASLKKFIPADHLWPIDDVWRFHAGGSNTTRDMSDYLGGLDHRYGPSTSLDDFLQKSQLAAYEGVRAMFEAYGRNKYTSTGVIQWMLNDPWPGIMWHLFDYYLAPGGGYFGAKQACEPLHIQYGYDDHSVSIVNGLPRAFVGLRATAELYGMDGQRRYARTATLDVGDDASVRAFVLPDATSLGLGATYLLRLVLADGAGAPVSRNAYWLSLTPDVPDFEHGNNYVTPTASYGDLTGLSSLAPATLTAKAARTPGDAPGEERVRVTLTAGAQLAFFVRVEVAAGADEVAPIRWEDNYVTLWPGETRDLVARYRKADLHGAAATVRLAGWNVAPTTVALP